MSTDLRRIIASLVAALLVLAGGSAWADTVHVAVAANFTEPAQEIAAAFRRASGDNAVLSFGASGAFYTQIANGAPFEVFLSADADRPAAAERAGLVRAGKPLHLRGGPAGALFDPAGAGRCRRGRAAAGQFREARDRRSGGGALRRRRGRDDAPARRLEAALAPKIVKGSSIAQAYQFVATGAAELGFVALSQVIGVPGGSRWIVPERLHAPIAQQAVLLKTGAASKAARAFMAFLKSGTARAIIRRYGYTDRALGQGSRMDLVIRTTLALAAVTTMILLLLLATPLAWWLARSRRWSNEIVGALVALPLVLPPTVIGFYLLVALGPGQPADDAARTRSASGPWPSPSPGLVIGSLFYSLPFAVQPLRSAFEAVGDAAAGGGRDDGRGAARPLRSPWRCRWRGAGFVSAAILVFAHTVGEFGVVLMIGGAIPGETEVLSTRIYQLVESLDFARRAPDRRGAGGVRVRGAAGAAAGRPAARPRTSMTIRLALRGALEPRISRSTLEVALARWLGRHRADRPVGLGQDHDAARLAGLERLPGHGPLRRRGLAGRRAGSCPRTGGAIGYVFQGASLLPHLSVGAEPRLCRTRARRRAVRPRRMIIAVPASRRCSIARPARLSGGEASVRRSRARWSSQPRCC